MVLRSLETPNTSLGLDPLLLRSRKTKICIVVVKFEVTCTMDKYVKVKQIGEGSFGKALLVKSKENGKQFVVKEINMAKMGRKERDDARKETAVLAQLHHPNIVMYQESFEGDLYARINMQRGVLFPEDMVLDWFVQTCLAVKHIHDRKILHRDIKSQNIFLTRHGIVKLGDFGIAKVLNSTVELARTCIGTPYYLSPEICENKPYNNKSDIWSLGCVLYEVTTLKHAFTRLVGKSQTANSSLKSLTCKSSLKSVTCKANLKLLTRKSSLKSLTCKSSLKSVTCKSNLKLLTRKSSLKSLTCKSSLKSLTCKSSLKSVTCKSNLKLLTRKSSLKSLTCKSSLKSLTCKSSLKSVTYKSSLKSVTCKSSLKSITPKFKSSLESSLGSYPPPSPRYSYELRNLIAALFRRSARDRPSITSVLRKPILQMRIRKFLSESEVDDEFSHTVMHGKKIQKALTPGARGWAQPPRPVAAKKTPIRATPRYDPASVYGPSVARRSKENARRSADVRKSSGEKRPSSAGASTPDLVKRRKELIVKERKRREEEAKRKEQQYMRQHRDIIEKQRVARMMKAREEGWKHLMSSQESNDSDKVMKEEPKRPSSAASPKPASAPRDRGNYEAYHAWLDKQDEERRGIAPPPRPGPHLGVAGALGYQDAPSHSPSPAPGGAIPSAQMAARQGEQAGAKGADAAERARILEEYQLRKQQAAAYKARAQGNVFGGAAAAPRRAPPTPKPSAGRPSSSNSSNQPTPAASRDGESEQDYLARLRQIRLQNFNERRVQKAKQEAKADAKYKAQAEDRANKLKADLEAETKRSLRAGRGREADKAHKPPLPAKPVKVIPLTEAMNAISAPKVEPKKPDVPLKPAIGMTAAMQAIGVSGSPPPAADKPGSPLQKRKAEILKRLNAKPPWAPKQDRPKWGEPVVMPAVERPHWNSGDKSPFSQLPLEETASHMEATNAGDLVVRHPSMAATPKIPVATGNDQKEADRKHWGGPAGTVLNVLQSAQLTDTAMSDVSEVGSVEGNAQGDPAKVAGVQDDSTEKKEEPHQTKAPVIGSTFTVIRSPLRGISVMQKISPKKDTGNKDQPDAPEATEVASEPSPALSQQEKVQEQAKPSSSVTQDILAGDDNDKEAEESVAEGSPQVAPQQHAAETAESALFEKVPLSNEPEGTSVRNTEVIQVEDIEDTSGKDEDEESKKEEITERTLTTDNTENKDSETGEAAKRVEEKDDEGDDCRRRQAGRTAGVILGLTMGHFDAAINLLRTCSEPDLCKLTHSEPEADVISSVSEAALHDLGSDPSLAEVSSVEEVTESEKGKSSDDGNRSSSELGDNKSSEGETGSSSLVRDVKIQSEKEKERETAEEKDTDETEVGKEEGGGGDEGEEEGSSRSTDDDNDDDDSELDTVRASMMLVLEGATASDEDDEPLTARSGSKKTKAKKTKVKKTKSKAKAKASETGDNANRKWSASSMADLCSIRETMKDLLQPHPRDGKENH
ncbi:Serine/threonine-protein kinase Nek1 [Lamellibrachia satsuma]|nr:Serine/threonine-protein kinase Nek1 [Lamellibrachia satsuma]